MNKNLSVWQQSYAVDPNREEPLAEAAQAAKESFHPTAVFAEHYAIRAANTIARYSYDLAHFVFFLAEYGFVEHCQGESYAKALFTDPGQWANINAELTRAYRDWMLWETSYAIGTIKGRLMTIRMYASLASKAGYLKASELLRIRDIKVEKAKKIDKKRQRAGLETRLGAKKSSPTPIGTDQAEELTSVDVAYNEVATRNALIMCLLLEHGLRVSEVSDLRRNNIDLEAGTITFYRRKVDREQTHELSVLTLVALRKLLPSLPMQMDGIADQPLLPRAWRGGRLEYSKPLSTKGINWLVGQMGDEIGLPNLSPHDCRHYWATKWAKQVDPFRLMEAGGWQNLDTPRQYIRRARIANEGMTS